MPFQTDRNFLNFDLLTLWKFSANPCWLLPLPTTPTTKQHQHQYPRSFCLHSSDLLREKLYIARQNLKFKAKDIIFFKKLLLFCVSLFCLLSDTYFLIIIINNIVQTKCFINYYFLLWKQIVILFVVKSESIIGGFHSHMVD
jgi:hypothetical protein